MLYSLSGVLQARSTSEKVKKLMGKGQSFNKLLI